MYDKVNKSDNMLNDHGFAAVIVVLAILMAVTISFIIWLCGYGYSSHNVSRLPGFLQSSEF